MRLIFVSGLSGAGKSVKEDGSRQLKVKASTKLKQKLRKMQTCVRQNA